MNTIGTFRFNDALSAGLSAFWAEIAKQFPECATGDLSPEMSYRMEEEVGRYLTAWLDANQGKEARR